MALLLSLALASMLATAAQPITAEREMLAIDVPDNFRIANQQRNTVSELQEIVQFPETVENWTKLVTNIIGFGDAKKVTVEQFYTDWRAKLVLGCPGMSETHIAGTVDGLPAIRAEISCPLNPTTVKPENLTAVVVAGRVNIMVSQVAFRHARTAEDAALVDHVVASMKICDASAIDACSARKAIGFVAEQEVKPSH